MPASSSTLGSTSSSQCGFHDLSCVDSDSLANAESRAREQHKRRLSRIVADQWMHVARKRLTMAWCSQIVHCWGKLCLENRWTRKHTLRAAEHHTRNKSLKVFNAFREGSRMKQRNQSAAVEFHKEVLEKKTLKGLSKARLNYRQHHEQYCLAKAFRVVKNYHEKKKVTKCKCNGAQSFYGASLKKHALSGFSNHRKSRSSRQTAASFHWKKSMKSRILKCWSTVANRISNLRDKGDQSRLLLLKALLKRCMINWLLVTHETANVREDKIAQATQKFSKLRKKQMLRAWAYWNREKQSRHLKMKQAAMMHGDRTYAVVTNAWRNYVIEKENNRAKSSMAFSFRRKQALTDALAVWKAYQAKKQSAGAAAMKAFAHLKQNLTQKSMGAWKPWHKKQISKKQGREEALHIYKSRLQRWACERILAVGLMLQALRLQSSVGRQPMSSASSYMKVAPYARKWWFLTQRRNNLRKTMLHRNEEGSLQAPHKGKVQISNKSKEPFMQEILLRIGIDKDGIKIQHERNRPSSPLVEMTNVHERPKPRGRELLPAPSPTIIQPPETPTSPAIRQRPAPRRPAFLSFQLSP